MNKLDRCLYFTSGSIRILWSLIGMVLICRLIWSGYEPILFIAWAEIIALVGLIGWNTIESIGFFDYALSPTPKGGFK